MVTKKFKHVAKKLPTEASQRNNQNQNTAQKNDLTNVSYDSFSDCITKSESKALPDDLE